MSDQAWGRREAMSDGEGGDPHRSLSVRGGLRPRAFPGSIQGPAHGVVLNNPLPRTFPAPLDPEGLGTARSEVSICAPEPQQGPHPQSGLWWGGLYLGVPGQSCPTKVVSISVGEAFWPSTFSRWNLQMVERTCQRVRAKHGADGRRAPGPSPSMGSRPGSHQALRFPNPEGAVP